MNAASVVHDLFGAYIFHQRLPPLKTQHPFVSFSIPDRVEPAPPFTLRAFGHCTEPTLSLNNLHGNSGEVRQAPVPPYDLRHL